jgi:hypothetical protein
MSLFGSSYNEDWGCQDCIDKDKEIERLKNQIPHHTPVHQKYVDQVNKDAWKMEEEKYALAMDVLAKYGITFKGEYDFLCKCRAIVEDENEIIEYYDEDRKEVKRVIIFYPYERDLDKESHKISFSQKYEIVFDAS